MRVRISYGVELENLPTLAADEIHRALKPLIIELKDMEEEMALFKRVGEKAPVAALETSERLILKIEKLRECLNKADQTLADFGSIFEGYHGSSEQKEPEKNE